MTLHCQCKICKKSPAGKNRNSKPTGEAEVMKGASYALRNGDVLQHWSRHDYDTLISTEKAQYQGGHQVVCGFFLLYTNGAIPPVVTPKQIQNVVKGKVTHIYEISAAVLIETHINTNQFQVYTRTPIKPTSEVSGMEAVVVMGCGEPIAFNSTTERRAPNLTIHKCIGFSAFR